MKQKQPLEFDLTKEYRDRFQIALDEQDIEFIKKSLEDVNAADITALLYEFNREESKFVIDLLPVEVRSEIINDLDSDARKNFLKIYKQAELVEIINLLASDDAADILNELPIKESEEVIAQLDAELKSQVIDLLNP